MAGAIRLELRRNRHIARALHRGDGWIPGTGSQAGAADGWGEDARGRHCCGCGCLFASRSKLERRSAGCRARSWRDRLEHPAPDRIEPRRRGLRGTALARRARHLQLCRGSREDGVALDHRLPDCGDLLALDRNSCRRNRALGGRGHLAVAASGDIGERGAHTYSVRTEQSRRLDQAAAQRLSSSADDWRDR